MPFYDAKFLKPENRFFGLFVGPSGSGKTCASCSFPGRKYVMDYDGRIKGILGAKWCDEKIQKGEIQFNSYNSKHTLGDIDKDFDLLETKINMKEVDLCIFSSISSMVRFILGETIASDKKDGGIKHFKFQNYVMTQVQDYGVVAAVINNWIYERIKSFKCSVIVEAHLKDTYVNAPTAEDPNHVIITGRALKAPGQLAEEIPTWFDETYEFVVDDLNMAMPPRRYVITSSKIAKTCIKGLPRKIDITDRSLYETIKEHFPKGEK